MEPDAYDPEQTRIAAPLSGEETRVAANEPGQEAEADATRIAPAATEAGQAPRPAGEPAEGYKVGHRICRFVGPNSEREDLYEILAVHYGGMGIVYCAYSFENSLRVALKTLRERYANDDRARQLFTEEGRTWVRLGKHPYIARAGDVRTFDERPYLLTDWIQGPDGMGNDLRGWLGHPRLTLAVAVEMALQIAQGMQHATAKVPGLIHRDLKPANILVDGHGRVKVTDFGLAATDDSGAGTPAYMAPEQWLGGVADARTDIYAYGAIVYEMLTGHRLFGARNADEWRAAHLMRAPAAPRTLQSGIPAGLENFVLRCMAKDRALRPGSWDEVVSEMAGWFHELTGQPAVLDFSAFAATPEEIFQDGWCFFALEAYEDALAAYERCLELKPRSATAWKNKAITLLRLKRSEEATAALDCALSIDPGSADVWRFKAQLLRTQSRYEELLAAYERLVEIEGPSAAAWGDIGWAQYLLHRHDAALETIDRGLELDPHSTRLLMQRAQCLWWLKREAEALEASERAMEIEPRSPQVLRHRGCLLRDAKRPMEALEFFRRTLEIEPWDTSAMEYMAKLLLKLDRWQEALDLLDRLVTCDLGVFAGWGLRGNALRGLRRYEEALESFDKALQVVPKSGNAWNGKGDVLRDLGRFDEALAAYDRVTDLIPRHVPVWRKKAAIQCSLGRWTEVLTICDRFKELFPKYEIWREKRTALMGLERYEEALAASDGETQKSPDSVEAWEGRGAVLMALGRADEALGAYETAVGLKPETDEARAAHQSAQRRVEALRIRPITGEAPRREKPGWFGRLLGRRG